jgi:3-deoxy-7-phosphoheptulonate synthase
MSTASATADVAAAADGRLSLAAEDAWGFGEVTPPTVLQLDASEPLATPRAFRAAMAGTPAVWRSVREGRETLRRIVRGQDSRFLAIVGPCSIHDVDAAREYGRRLAALRHRYADRLVLVMRAYFEKPRTTVGWRGMISDPYLDGTCDLAEGLRRARRLLIDLGEMQLPAAAELLDLETPGYYADLISLACIGARTTESQPHRALASALDLPVGFKNGTDGGVQVAVNAMRSAREPHNYVTVDDDGRPCAVRTRGNRDTVLVLRGGAGCVPNYDPESVAAAEEGLRAAGFDRPALLVDGSHANSGYDPERQIDACLSAATQRRAGRTSLRGVLIESHLIGGKQSLSADSVSRLRYGVSVTDACLGWEDTAALLEDLYRALG